MVNQEFFNPSNFLKAPVQCDGIPPQQVVLQQATLSPNRLERLQVALPKKVFGRIAILVKFAWKMKKLKDLVVLGYGLVRAPCALFYPEEVAKVESLLLPIYTAILLNKRLQNGSVRFGCGAALKLARSLVYESLSFVQEINMYASEHLTVRYRRLQNKLRS